MSPANEKTRSDGSLVALKYGLCQQRQSASMANQLHKEMCNVLPKYQTKNTKQWTSIEFCWHMATLKCLVQSTERLAAAAWQMAAATAHRCVLTASSQMRSSVVISGPCYLTVCVLSFHCVKLTYSWNMEYAWLPTTQVHLPSVCRITNFLTFRNVQVLSVCGNLCSLVQVQHHQVCRRYASLFINAKKLPSLHTV